MRTGMISAFANQSFPVLVRDYGSLSGFYPNHKKEVIFPL